MGAYADWDAFISSIKNPQQVPIIAQKASVSNNAARVNSSWTGAGGVGGTGVAPTTAAVPTKATTGAIQEWVNAGTGALRIPFVEAASLNTGAAMPFTWMLCDRLSHQGGLDGTVTTAQSTNLPTAALTRYTTGEGVMAAFEIYSQVGTTATTISASYTDQAGGSGHVSPLVVFGSTNFREAGRMVLMPLAVGDTGVRAVANVTVTATTGTAGAFGVTLFKPLLWVTVLGFHNGSHDPIVGGTMAGGLPEIVDDACLFWTYVGTAGNANTLRSNLTFAET